MYPFFNLLLLFYVLTVFLGLQVALEFLLFPLLFLRFPRSVLNLEYPVFVADFIEEFEHIEECSDGELIVKKLHPHRFIGIFKSFNALKFVLNVIFGIFLSLLSINKSIKSLNFEESLSGFL